MPTVVARPLEVNDHEVVGAAWLKGVAAIVFGFLGSAVMAVNDDIVRIEISVRDSGLVHLLDKAAQTRELFHPSVVVQYCDRRYPLTQSMCTLDKASYNESSWSCSQSWPSISRR